MTNQLVATKRKPDEILTDEEALGVITKAVKQRMDSIEQFTSGNRMDLVENEKSELAILQPYLPSLMGEDEIQKVVDAKIKELSVTDKSQMGKLIGVIMRELKGKADGALVKTIVEKSLV